MKKKIVVFSGAGLDRESGVLTFRDCKDGLWNNYKIEDVATPSGWANSREKVLEFYNERRKQMPEVQPNEAHKLLASLEEEYDVIHVTQNVSDLLERAGSTSVIHLHGELTKARGSIYSNRLAPDEHIIDIGYNDIQMGDKCKFTDSQLRPHICWFGEIPFGVSEAYKAIGEADILLVIGTSMNITYTYDMLASANDDCKVFYIDPEPSLHLSKCMNNTIEYLKFGAVEGMSNFINNLKTEVCE